ncbi:T9SS type A sorting domain-containing protein, partial [Halalkalibaculum sp. DA3122]|uniref:T9SS type A sorting domain-containing protein n=1 Tax=unclassified Halalkalibaculum TaxID=2964617 RepID=UPI0037546440
GTYRLEVTNPQVPELTLQSIPITITEQDLNGSTDEGDSSSAPETPSLLSPEEAAEGKATTLTLDWSSSSGADQYQLQVATDGSFGSTFIDQNDLKESAREISDLDHSNTYYWRVRASNTAGESNWSESRSFTTAEASVSPGLSAPVQLSPADDGSNISAASTFEWKPVEGADYYVLHANRIDPAEMVVETEVNGTSYTPPGGLDPETTHDWRVRAVKDGAEGEWSPIWRFTTGSGFDFTLKLTGTEGMRMVSVPAANKTLDDLLGSLWNQGIPGSNAESQDPNIFVWNEENQEFETPSSMSSKMEPGKGYLTWVFEDNNPGKEGVQEGFPKVLGVDGSENSSPVTVPISVTDSDNSTIIDGQEGWNLVGNPYGVPILVDKILEAAREVNPQVNANLYIWDHIQSQYQSLPEGGGHTIDPFQVFWLRYLDKGEGPLTLDKASISASNQGNLNKVVNTSASDHKEEKSILFLMEQDSTSSDRYIIEFNERGKVGVDLFDAYKLSSLNPMQSSSLQLYSIEGKRGEQFSKSVLPDTLTGEFRIQLGFSSPNQQEITLKWPRLVNIPQEWSVVLQDLRQNRTINLRNSDSYTFNAAAGSDESRFVLDISPAPKIEPNPVEEPRAIKLSQNYPNPFNPTTEIEYSVDREVAVNLTIYNLIGKKVATLVNNRVQSQGTYSVRFDASKLTSGIYIYRLSVGSKTFTKKMTLIK